MSIVVFHQKIKIKKNPKRLRKDEDRGGGCRTDDYNLLWLNNDNNTTTTIPKNSTRCNRLKYNPNTSRYCSLNIDKLILGFCIAVIFLIENCWAGYACLSNPCIFGVCIDDINR